MADAAAAADEDHADIGDVDHGHAVVAGAARQLERRKTLGSNGLRDLRLQPGGTGHGAVLVGDVELQREIAAFGCCLDLADNVGDREPAVHVGRRADVDGKGHLPRDHIGGAGHGVDVADGADQAVPVGAAKMLDRADALGGARERIAPQRHRYGAGVPGHAGQPRRHPCRARNRGDDADGKVFGFQHRPLLDMQFEIGEQFAAGTRGGADMIGIEAEVLQRLAHGNAVGIAHPQHALVKGAGDRAAAEQRGGEADALLVGKAGDLDRERQPLAAPVQVRDAGDRGDEAERPIPFAGVTHGIVMRAEHQAWQAGRSALVAAADIADGIEMRVHAGFAHPGQDQIGRGAMLFGEKDAGEMLVVFRNRAERVDPADDLLAERELLQPGRSHVHPAHAFVWPIDTNLMPAIISRPLEVDGIRPKARSIPAKCSTRLHTIQK